MSIYSDNKIIFFNDSGLNTGYDEGWDNIESGFQRRIFLGFMPTYQKGVIPLVNLDNSNISRYSYSSGRIEFIRSIGSAYQGDKIVDFKMQKNYNSSNYHWTEYHRDSSTIQRCKFTWNGIPWGGLYSYSSAQSHMAWFWGSSTEELSEGWYIPYQRTDNNNVINSEIYNSLILEG